MTRYTKVDLKFFKILPILSYILCICKPNLHKSWIKETLFTLYYMVFWIGMLFPHVIKYWISDGAIFKHAEVASSFIVLLNFLLSAKLTFTQDKFLTQFRGRVLNLFSLISSVERGNCLRTYNFYIFFSIAQAIFLVSIIINASYLQFSNKWTLTTLLLSKIQICVVTMEIGLILIIQRYCLRHFNKSLYDTMTTSPIWIIIRNFAERKQNMLKYFKIYEELLSLLSCTKQIYSYAFIILILSVTNAVLFLCHILIKEFLQIVKEDLTLGSKPALNTIQIFLNTVSICLVA